MHDLFTMCDIHFAGMWFLQQNLKVLIYSFTCFTQFLSFLIFINFYVRRMGRYMVPRVKDNNPLARKRFRRGVGSWGPPGKLQNFITYHLSNTYVVAVVTWLDYCRYGVKPQTINQSIIKFLECFFKLWKKALHFVILDSVWINGKTSTTFQCC